MKKKIEGERNMVEPMKAPNLQEWTARYGGYANIPWAEWDAAVAAWQEWRREQLKRDQAESARLRAHGYDARDRLRQVLQRELDDIRAMPAAPEAQPRDLDDAPDECPF
jgi:hypothetical protein